MPFRSQIIPTSIARTCAQMLYGRTDEPHDKANQTPEWQAGYRAGLEAERALEAIEAEFARRGEIESPEFQEWKCGLWAAYLQRAEMQAIAKAHPLSGISTP